MSELCVRDSQQRVNQSQDGFPEPCHSFILELFHEAVSLLQWGNFSKKLSANLVGVYLFLDMLVVIGEQEKKEEPESLAGVYYMLGINTCESVGIK